MTEKFDVATASDRELAIGRIINAPSEKLYRAWTEPEILKKWFVPRPWTIARAEIDVRPGGQSLVVMRDPEGKEFPNRGIYLEVAPNEKLVFTDAYVSAWQPSEKPFMTAVVTFEDLGDGRTRYIARALHWTTEDRRTHEEMGFYEGWGQVAEQLEEVAKML